VALFPTSNEVAKMDMGKPTETRTDAAPIGADHPLRPSYINSLEWPMKTTRYKPWMCSTCGYMMDAASATRISADGAADVTPTEGDVSLCLNCGTLYLLQDNKWRPPTAAEKAEFPADLKRTLFEHEMARQSVIDTDLSRRGGRA
jgi:hypothetical protein